VSLAFESLFCVTASKEPAHARLAAIDQIHKLLEEWRQSVPAEFRPRERIQSARLANSSTKQVVLRTHFYYYNLVIALERLTLHIDSERGSRWEASKLSLQNAARIVLELTQLIEVASYTPVL
jgi:hypothetical protein